MLPSLGKLNLNSATSIPSGAGVARTSDGAQSKSFLIGLPRDIKEQILRAVERDDCKALNAICRTSDAFREICNDDRFWLSLLQSRGWLVRPELASDFTSRRAYSMVCRAFGSLEPEVRRRQINDAMFAAIDDGDPRRFRFVLAIGGDVNLVDTTRNGATPLASASAKNKINLIPILLNAGANVHAQNEQALRVASFRGHVNVVQLLIERGADIHIAEDSPLWIAASEGHAGLVELLLQRGAIVNAGDDLALLAASENGHANVVALLIAVGANVNADDGIALKAAQDKGHKEVVRLLIEAGAVS